MKKLILAIAVLTLALSAIGQRGGSSFGGSRSSFGGGSSSFGGGRSSFSGGSSFGGRSSSFGGGRSSYSPSNRGSMTGGSSPSFGGTRSTTTSKGSFGGSTASRGSFGGSNPSVTGRTSTTYTPTRRWNIGARPTVHYKTTYIVGGRTVYWYPGGGYSYIAGGPIVGYYDPYVAPMPVNTFPAVEWILGGVVIIGCVAGIALVVSRS